MPTTKTIPLPAPAATAASFCVFTDASATPVACATSAPSYLQTCTTRLGANPSGTRCCRSLILRVHQHVSHADGLPCLCTSSSPSVCHPTRGKPVRHPLKPQLHLACFPSRQPRRWRALPPHLHLFKSVLPDSMRAHLAPDAAVASSCVFTNMLAAPMARAASAPPSVQARANRLDASPLGKRCCRTLTLRVHHELSHTDGVRCLRTITSPSVCHPTRR